MGKEDDGVDVCSGDYPSPPAPHTPHRETDGARRTALNYGAPLSGRKARSVASATDRSIDDEVVESSQALLLCVGFYVLF